MKKSILLFAIIALTITSCTHPIDIEKEVKELKQVDIEFSNYSIEHGLREAFLAYLHDEGVILRENSMPIEGFANVANLFSGDFSQSQLSWEPLFAKIAKSGDLAYTYGTYDFWDKTTDKHRYGTYVTIWEKNELGEWKMILDSGNSGLKNN